MRFQVPQFIEVEDKIFGPLTFKQFIYLAGAGGITIVAFSLLPKFIAFIVATPFIALGVTLAFYKVNNRPFIIVVESFFKYITKEKLYIWKKAEKTATESSAKGAASPSIYLPKLSESKLKDMSWSLDVSNQKTERNNDE